MVDNRLGRKAEDGSVDVWPERYPDGSPFNRYAQAPTMLTLDSRYFVVLPHGVNGLPQDMIDELLGTVGGNKSKATKTKELPPVDDEGVG